MPKQIPQPPHISDNRGGEVYSFNKIFEKTYYDELLTYQEALILYENAQTAELIYWADMLRKKLHQNNIVTWIVDRNVNISNICESHCKFCNFFRSEYSNEAFITQKESYRKKIDELFELGGSQLLLQGGMSSKLGLAFYVDLFKFLKQYQPKLKLHALGPPEVFFLAQLEQISIKQTLKILVDAGLDSLPGAGAEILVDEIRAKISPKKCTTQQWLEVMSEAHSLGLTTSATMMFGHIEQPKHRIEHLIHIQKVQAQKPQNSMGFISFIPWPFQSKNTVIAKQTKQNYSTSTEAYIRLLAISRLILNNVPNIQVSWLTVGMPVAQICLHSGANDMGSIMIEEHVVSAAGASYSANSTEMLRIIKAAGFTPQKRNQQFEFIS